MTVANEGDLNHPDGWYPLPTSSLLVILALPLRSMNKQQFVHFQMGAERPVKLKMVRYLSPRIPTYPGSPLIFTNDSPPHPSPSSTPCSSMSLPPFRFVRRDLSTIETDPRVFIPTQILEHREDNVHLRSAPRS